MEELKVQASNKADPREKSLLSLTMIMTLNKPMSNSESFYLNLTNVLWKSKMLNLKVPLMMLWNNYMTTTVQIKELMIQLVLIMIR